MNNSRTRAEMVKTQSDYIEAIKLVKRDIGVNKWKYVVDIATTMESSAREGNMKQPYDTTKKLVMIYSKPERPFKYKEGKAMTEIQEERNSWVEHFME
ncbi:unnamed protein product [Schistosoma margrebowiei]|uniref:Uncharacterized protein n=1 Tax=Schistosoma margrebowiei TaxID=48269 RepID=A0A183LUK9_9TREM|nr:unnamed protein product [Schistosoma margrebowiei]